MHLANPPLMASALHHTLNRPPATPQSPADTVFYYGPRLSVSRTPMICWPPADPTRTAGPGLISCCLILNFTRLIRRVVVRSSQISRLPDSSADARIIVGRSENRI